MIESIFANSLTTKLVRNGELEEFLGYITELKAALSDSDIEYFEKPFLAKYLITKKGGLKLLNRNGSESEVIMFKEKEPRYFRIFKARARMK